jgi:2-dehydro-3-deoxygalactonokinase
VSRECEAENIVGINWGSSNFRAYRIAPDGSLIDEYAEPTGVAALDRSGMAAMVAKLSELWPGTAPMLASGMIGSNIGWVEVPYAEAPSSTQSLAQACTSVQIGTSKVTIVPGVACRRGFDEASDIMRGEEVEITGLVALGYHDGIAALPGTHTKWVRLAQGCVTDFFTSMSGEIFDRLTKQGLLASIVEQEARDGAAFQAGVSAGKARRLGLGTLLFGARARVIRGDLTRADAASYVRGILIGSEIADALAMYPELCGETVPLVGSGAVTEMYAAALAASGVSTRCVASRDACLRGFRSVYDARQMISERDYQPA